MKFQLNIKNTAILKAFAVVLGCTLGASLTGCTDDLEISDPSTGSGSSVFKGDLENSLLIPLSIDISDTGKSRADSDSDVSGLTDDNGLHNGTSMEHYIEFSGDKECFAIFFLNDEFYALTPLYQNTSLGVGTIPDDGIGEYNVFAYAYIKNPDGWDFRAQEEEESDEDYQSKKAQWENMNNPEGRRILLPDQVLVVLNGGRIHDYIIKKYNIDPTTGYQSQESKDKGEKFKTQDFLDFKWDYNMAQEVSGFEGRMQVIGANKRGYYTMTNSAYYGPDDENDKEDENKYKLQTVTKLDRSKIVPALASNLKKENSAATVYVERMVAKFSAPKFLTEVIGSDKIFIPSQSARPVTIYSYNKTNNIWTSEDTKWRVHVLGWTINGREKSNYLFKHIKQAWGEDENGNIKHNSNLLTNWNSKFWNDPDHKRSYWSIDPHYECNPDNENKDKETEDGTFHFYPWQFRGAMDKNHISWLHQSSDNEEETNIVLRYLTFDEVAKWDDEAITISENTFNPYYKGDFYVGSKSPYLDGRATMLMGPHLLVTAELYLAAAESDNDYVSAFNRVQNLFGDRYFRYYRTEYDLIRMFIKDVDDAVRTQEQMTFTLYDWNNSTSGDNTPPTYEVDSKDNCALLISCNLDPSTFDDKKQDGYTYSERDVYEYIQSLKDEKGNPKYHEKRLFEVIDDLWEDLSKMGYHMYIEAHIKDGDARVIPWIPGIVFRNVKNTSEILPVRNKTTQQSFDEWDNNMRKSLILKWFGPVDHYYRGYMYYAHDIPHHIIDKDTGEGYYGAVRNHWYTFTVTSINALGTPVGNTGQRIIPGRYKYEDQMSVYVSPAGWHLGGDVTVDFK